jgi:hypothetical protein
LPPPRAQTNPTNPQAQVSTSGSGTGATFTLTWAATNIWEVADVTVTGESIVSKIKTAVYDPPERGLPYLVVSIIGSEVHAVPVTSREAAKALLEARRALHDQYRTKSPKDR